MRRNTCGIGFRCVKIRTSNRCTGSTRNLKKKFFPDSERARNSTSERMKTETIFKQFFCLGGGGDGDN
jgi:hypothetical protein